jgi:hypothetical protein
MFMFTFIEWFFGESSMPFAVLRRLSVYVSLGGALRTEGFAFELLSDF